MPPTSLNVASGLSKCASAMRCSFATCSFEYVATRLPSSSKESFVRAPTPNPSCELTASVDWVPEEKDVVSVEKSKVTGVPVVPPGA